MLNFTHVNHCVRTKTMIIQWLCFCEVKKLGLHQQRLCILFALRKLFYFFIYFHKAFLYYEYASTYKAFYTKIFLTINWISAKRILINKKFSSYRPRQCLKYGSERNEFIYWDSNFTDSYYEYLLYNTYNLMLGYIVYTLTYRGAWRRQ